MVQRRPIVDEFGMLAEISGGDTVDVLAGGTGLNAFAAGDIIYADALNSLASLPIGTDEQVLTSNAGQVSWEDAEGGGGIEGLTDEFIPFWSDASGGLVDSPLMASGERLGLGNQNPQGTLHISNELDKAAELILDFSQSGFASQVTLVASVFSGASVGQISWRTSFVVNQMARIRVIRGSTEEIGEFLFFVGTLLAVKISESGNCGFLVSDPTAVVDVIGSTTVSASLRLRPGVDPAAPNDGDQWNDGTDMLAFVGGTTKNMTAGGGGGIEGLTDTFIPLWSDGIGGLIDSPVRAEDGLVGIGVSPDAKLHVFAESGVKSEILLESDKTGNGDLDKPAVTIIRPTANGQVLGSIRWMNSASASPAGEIVFIQGSGVNDGGFTFNTSGLQRFAIDPNGNVKVGTFGVPTAYLVINASVAGQASLRLLQGVAPSSPNDGDQWNDGTDMLAFVGGSIKNMTGGAGLIEALTVRIDALEALVQSLLP